jgi:hypothetical protein
MRSSLFIVACGAGLIAASTAFADGAQPAATPQPAVVAQPASAVGPDTVLCHHYVHEGLMLRTGECHTQKVWDQMRADSQKQIFDFQMRTLTYNYHRN